MPESALEPAAFVALSTCSTAYDLASSLAGTAGDVWSGDTDISLACKAPAVELCFDISAVPYVV
jgi:hypothetical protein